MADFQYLIADDVPQALKWLSEHKDEIKVLGGGSDILVRIRDEKEEPGYLLDISALGLDYIMEKDNGTRIGAMTTLNKLIDSPVILEKHPIIAEAAMEVGGVQTRNIGTIGGNLCTGLPSADMALPLIVSGASLVIEDCSGETQMAAEEFFISPRKVQLGQSGLLKEIYIPNKTETVKQGYSFIKFGKRKAMRLCILSVAINMEIDPDENKIDGLKVAMGTVAPVPLRLKKVEDYMVGKIFNESLLDGAAVIIEGSIQPRTSVRATCEFRTDLAHVLFKRAAKQAFNRALGGGADNDN